MQIECLLDARAQVGESPVWSIAEQCLWWCDITGRRLHRLDPQSRQNRSWVMPSEPGCLALDDEGGLIVALRNGLHHFDPVTTQLSLLCRSDYDQATTRFNDGRADMHGNFWVGSMFEPRTSAAAALYRFDGHALQKMADGITVANGLAFSPDGRIAYLADSPARKVESFDVDIQTGQLSGRRLFYTFKPDEGRPDGAVIDAEGYYWVALYAGGSIVRIAPDGSCVRRVKVPVERPTKLAFGGPDLKEIFITSARDGADAKELTSKPLSGGLFRCSLDVAGLPEPVFQRRKVFA